MKLVKYNIAERKALSLYNQLEHNYCPRCHGELSRLITPLMDNLILNQFKCKRCNYSLTLTSIIKMA